MVTSLISRCLFIVSIFSLLFPSVKPFQPTQNQGSPEAPPPDLVLIVTDDQPWHTMPLMPLTNQLLGENGVTFTHAYVSTPYCCPSRASLLTGLYAHNHGVIGNEAPVGGATLFDDSSTLATWLDDAGYRTGLVGKYLNEYWRVSPYIPPGWDQWFAMSNRDLGVGGDYQRYTLNENGVEVDYNGTGSETYSTNALRDKAVEFIRTTPLDQPLLLYFAPNAPHTIIIPDPADEGKFADLEPYRPPSYNEADVSDKPAWLQSRPLLTGTQLEEIDALYRLQALALQPVDRAVQAIVDALEETNRLSNTVIVYTTDNGYALGDHRLTRKNCVYEICVKVPLLVRAPGLAPRLDDRLVQNIDLPVTLASFAGITPPDPVDGRSFADLLYNPGAPWRETIFLEVLDRPDLYIRNFQAVHTGEFVYSEYANGDRELYDLTSDPDQLENQVANPFYAPIIDRLAAGLQAYRGQTDLRIAASAAVLATGGQSSMSVTYTVSNQGPLIAAPLTLDYSIPEGMQLISCQTAPGNFCLSDEPAVHIRLLRPGETTGVEIALHGQASESMHMTARIDAFSPLESHPADNQVAVILNPYRSFLPTIR